MEIAIYENLDKTLGVVIPDSNALILFSLEIIAEKSTPLGLPFWLTEDSELPADNSERNAWRLDGTEGPPDGYGTKT